MSNGSVFKTLLLACVVICAFAGFGTLVVTSTKSVGAGRRAERQNVAADSENAVSRRAVIIVAEEAEETMVRKYLPDAECILAGIGASNIIRACAGIPAGTRVINIGFAGSNTLDIGTVAPVSATYRLMSDAYAFEDYHNPMEFDVEGGLPCYTSNSFVTETDMSEPTLFDMELNYIAAFPFEMVGAIKIVSDKLSVDEFVNNAIRDSGILSSPEVWNKVAALYYEIAGE